MGRIGETIVAGTLVAAVAGCSSEPVDLLYPDYDKTLVETTVTEMADFWQAQGVGMAGVKATVVVGSEKANCGTEEILSDSEEISICSDGNIIVPAQAINTIRTNHGKESRGALIGILAHEVGHRVYQQTPDLAKNAPQDPKAKHVHEELVATCIAGITIFNRRHIDPTETQGAYQAFLKAGDADNYGGGPAQAAAYSHGYEQQTKDPVKCVNVKMPSK